MDKIYREAINKIKNGDVVVMPTDTIYGVIADALNPNAVEKVYSLKERERSKHLLLQVATLNDLKLLIDDIDSYNIPELEKLFLEKPTTIIFENISDKYNYLHNGTKTIGVRIPPCTGIYADFLEQVGPVISTSANIAGMPNAKNIEEAKKYFGDKVDLYVDGGEITAEPSRVIKTGKSGKITEIFRA